MAYVNGKWIQDELVGPEGDDQRFLSKRGSTRSPLDSFKYSDDPTLARQQAEVINDIRTTGSPVLQGGRLPAALNMNTKNPLKIGAAAISQLIKPDKESVGDGAVLSKGKPIFLRNLFRMYRSGIEEPIGERLGQFGVAAGELGEKIASGASDTSAILSGDEDAMREMRKKRSADPDVPRAVAEADAVFLEKTALSQAGTTDTTGTTVPTQLDLLVPAKKRTLKGVSETYQGVKLPAKDTTTTTNQSWRTTVKDRLKFLSDVGVDISKFKSPDDVGPKGAMTKVWREKMGEFNKLGISPLEATLLSNKYQSENPNLKPDEAISKAMVDIKIQGVEDRYSKYSWYGREQKKDHVPTSRENEYAVLMGAMNDPDIGVRAFGFTNKEGKVDAQKLYQERVKVETARVLEKAGLTVDDKKLAAATKAVNLRKLKAQEDSVQTEEDVRGAVSKIIEDGSGRGKALNDYFDAIRWHERLGSNAGKNEKDQAEAAVKATYENLGADQPLANQIRMLNTLKSR